MNPFNNNTRRSDDESIPEEVPEYRSVMMMAPPAASPFAAPSTTQLGAAPLRRFEQQTKQKQQLSSVQHQTPKSLAESWDVSDVPALPSIYPLERTHVQVECPAQEAASRICNCLRSESIAATCDEDQKNRLVAETKECLAFSVQLFRQEPANQVIVEVQRRNGCSFLFHQIARTVLRAAKGVSNSNATAKRKFSIPSCCPEETLEQKQNCTLEGLEIAFSLMKGNKHDAHILALESLQQMTNSTSSECNAFAANKILSGSSLEELVTLIESSQQESSSPPASDMESEHQRLLHLHALSILASSLAALQQSGELSQTLLDRADSLCSKSFLSALVSTLDMASTRAHEACHAARCIRSLSTIESVRDQLLESGEVSSAVLSACDEGACRNAMLEQESKKLRLQLDI